ncbi:DegV family protein [Mycoplasma sp. Pen4]|uniref:DegV family protein n=1 Tax=Mycoplasma sp. Pen4 TaxID=640330 RepID=UPI001654968B|nr:DegV family protein [Mycoplasma sp. Pen4]QNM93884.1 DegV family protein [Mycoplasma sp. Pen4]
MKKLGIIIDSFSGYTEKQAKEEGFKFLPLQVEIDGVVYQDGIDNHKEILEKLSSSTNFKSSSPRLEIINEVVRQAAEEFEEVIFLGISSKLSSTSNHVRTVASDFKNVFVFENHFSGIQLINAAKYARRLYEEDGLSMREVFELLEKLNSESATFLVPKTLNYMIKGGRLTGIKKFLMSKISMLPVLEYSVDGSVSSTGLKRTVPGAVAKAVEKACYFTEDIDKYEFNWMHGIDKEINEMVLENANSFDISFNTEQITSSVIAIHTGPEAFAVTVMPKLK